jgi:hypothetical protein
MSSWRISLSGRSVVAAKTFPHTIDGRSSAVSKAGAYLHWVTVGDMDVAVEPTWTYLRRVTQRRYAPALPALDWKTRLLTQKSHNGVTRQVLAVAAAACLVLDQALVQIFLTNHHPVRNTD